MTNDLSKSLRGPTVRPSLLCIALLAASLFGGCMFQVRIDSTPGGADVLIDDVLVGTTPLILSFNPDTMVVTTFNPDEENRQRFDRKTAREWFFKDTPVTVKLDGYHPVSRTLKFGGPAKHSYDLVKIAKAQPGGAGKPVITVSAPKADAVMVGAPCQPVVQVGHGRGLPPVPPHRRAGADLPRGGGRRPFLVGTPLTGGTASGTVVSASALTDTGIETPQPAGQDRVSIVGGLDETVAKTPLESKTPPMGNIAFSFMSINPNGASSIDHMALDLDFEFPADMGSDLVLDILLGLSWVNATIRRNGPSIATSSLLGFGIKFGLGTVLPKSMLAVEMGELGWLRFGTSLKFPFVYSLMKGNMSAFGGAETDEEDYIFYALSLALFAEWHGKAKWNKILVPHAGFSFDILWSGSVLGASFSQQGVPMTFVAGVKANIGKWTYLFLDLSVWPDVIDLSLGLEAKL